MSSHVPWWDWGYWAYRASTAQANGAGGAIVLDITPAVGETMIIMEASGSNSGTNGVRIERTDEDSNIAARYVDVASAGTSKGALPQEASGSTTNTLVVTSVPMEARLFRGDDLFTIKQTGAGAQNDTLIIVVRAFLSEATMPTVAKGRSTNPGDVTIAAATENKIL